MNQYVDIVVTYNRVKLLEENVHALLNQTWKGHDIFVIDNGSIDETEKMIKSIRDKRLYYFNTGKNLGGAGGFSYGMRKALERGYSFAWLMDDDSVPEKDALESLITKQKALENNFSFLCSLVYWIDGKIFPMNTPNCNYKNVLDMQYDLLRKYKLVPIRYCSFVGCFVNLEVAYKVGLPISEFFIYGDDIEYTHRMRREKMAFLDLDSMIIHKAPSKEGSEIATAQLSRLSRFYYQSRNEIYINRKEKKILSGSVVLGKKLLKILLRSPDHKLKRICILIRGTISGFFFNPDIEFVRGYKKMS